MKMVQVINAGISGNTTTEMLMRLERDALSHHPDCVILMAGTNDCCNSQKLIDPEQVAANYKTLAEQILPYARLVLVTPMAVHFPYLAQRHPQEAYGKIPAEERLKLARKALHALATEKQLPLVDLGAISLGVGMIGEDSRSWLINPANGGKRDGVHPTADGYRAVASAIGAVVLIMHPRPTKIVCLGDSITFGDGVMGGGTSVGESYPAGLANILNAVELA